MRTPVLVWLACVAVGAAINPLPDRGPRLVSFSRAHGPGVVDAVGIGVMLAGWVVFLVALGRRRAWLAPRLTAAWGLSVAFALGLGLGLVIASAGADYPHWWVIGAMLLVGAQLVVGYLAGL